MWRISFQHERVSKMQYSVALTAKSRIAQSTDSVLVDNKSIYSLYQGDHPAGLPSTTPERHLWMHAAGLSHLARLALPINPAYIAVDDTKQ
jgi:hypothetical protein